MSLIESSTTPKFSRLLVQVQWTRHAYALPFAPFYLLYLYSLSLPYSDFYGSSEFAILAFVFLFFSNLLIYLMCQWSIRIKSYFQFRGCQSVELASHIVIIPAPHKGKGAIVPLQRIAYKKQTLIYFLFHEKKYVYDRERGIFKKLRYPIRLSFFDFKKHSGLVDISDRSLYGFNKFNLPSPTFQELFKEQAVAPFFIFQLFCIGLWCLDEYWYYSIFTLFMLVSFESMVVLQRQKNLSELKDMAQAPYPVLVHRCNKWIEMTFDELLPGDLVSLIHYKEEKTVPCDLLILDGHCIVNEAMLSGESTPQMKESIHLLDDSEMFDLELHKNHVVFGGTRVIVIV